MPNKTFELFSTFKAVKDNEDGLYIEGMASTSAIDRAGDVILASAWDNGGLTNFKNNPIILFNHNHNKPIGKATGFSITDAGLKIKAFISKAAPDGVYQLIKDGILGTFSVGFMIKDADYIEETGGLKIKMAELLETSVVSIPMNQTATFSLAKSFDSTEEYEAFKQTFTNREDLAGQSLAKDEVNASSIASNSLEGVQKSTHKEIKMGEQITLNKDDLEAIADKAAEKAAARFAMDQAKKEVAAKAAKEEAERKAAEAAALKSSIDNTVKDGTDQLVKDMEARLTAKGADMDEVIKSFRAEIEEKSAELKAMRESKQFFVDRSSGLSQKQLIEANREELINAHMFGIVTGKGWNSDYGKLILEKTGVNYTTDTTTGDLDQEVRDMIQKDIWLETKVASLFREIEVNGRATVLPVQPDTGYAVWQTTGIDASNVPGMTNRTGTSTANQYNISSVTMLVDRLITSTYMDNDVDEKTLVNIMPMLTQGVARAHARAVENAIMLPAATKAWIDDLEAASVASGSTVTVLGPDNGLVTASSLLTARAAMGKYGLNPTDIAYIVSQDAYYGLIQDPEFQNLNEVGAIATKLRGVVGGIFGSPVIVSEEFDAQGTGTIFARVVNTNNYVIPRLRGFRVENDYEVAKQRKMIVASQSLGFTELFNGDGAGNEPVVSAAWAAGT